MQFKEQCSPYIFYLILQILLCLISSVSHAGQIIFSLEYADKAITLKNSGNESVYNLDIYTLGQSQTWEKSEVQNNHFLAPGQTLQSIRNLGPTRKPLSLVDPVLLVGNEQSGAIFTQLAWRKSLPVSSALLPVSRNGRYVALDQNKTILRSTIFYYPQEGIQLLSASVMSKSKPPDPLVVEWSQKNRSILLDTGIGESGLWILNELMNGELGVQIVGDGVVKGKEQVPWWLARLRAEGLIWSMLLLMIGTGLMFLGGLSTALKKRG